MKARRFVAAAIALFLIGPGCRAEGSRGRCVIHDPDTVIRIQGEFFESISIVRRDADPNALLFLTNHNDPVTEKRESALRLNFKTGEQIDDWVPYEVAPPGYMRFQSGHPGPVQPLLASKTLRFEYLGRRSSRLLPNRNFDGHWSLVKEERFTGTRRIVYQDRPLLEQDFENYEWLVGIEEYVQIEPDGDRIVCLCTDDTGTRIAVFSKKKLSAHAERGKIK